MARRGRGGRNRDTGRKANNRRGSSGPGRGRSSNEKRANAKARAKVRLRKAQDKTGMSKADIKAIMRDKNLGNKIDSKKELQRVLKVAGRRQDKAAAKDQRQDEKRNQTQVSSMTRKAVAETGMSAATIRGIAADLGIKNIDSANDVYKIKQEVRMQENERINDSAQMGRAVERYNDLKETYDTNQASFQELQDNFDTVSGDYSTLKTSNKKTQEDLSKAKGILATAKGAIETRDKEVERLTGQVGDYSKTVGGLQGQISDYSKTIGGLQGQIGEYTKTIGGLQEQIGGYDTKIEGYKTDFNELTGKYEGVIKDNKELTTERDDAKERFAEQSELFEAAKAERDVYRTSQLNDQLAGLRGGATYGGGNQTSYGGGNLASGRSGYSSSTQSRDKGLADYVMQDGGATDSVLNREGPVVETMNRGGGGGGGSPRAMRRRTNSGGTGSYYASRFGG